MALEFAPRLHTNSNMNYQLIRNHAVDETALCACLASEDLSLLSIIEPEVLGYDEFQLADAACLSVADIYALESSGRIRSTRLDDGRRFYSYGEVAFLVGEEAV